ncbi:hypothetical protein QNA08_04890 [Chelatococcus sp. SYSU_G07232]|uniref:PetM family of cytochrome b6f complex subunit 7 n=1 Tax=Chelatococcus albus TaxID=3047466 RepID=A0ABT7ADW8_9HYPH|nr:hypothetical protein [Chelatococcus sp. SYSU_G07232]MDJ1157572.1 hypothetical protein [Chelatococcus sp. SYSU_G07232]
MRFFLRILGFLLVAGGFVSLVIDGTRAIANSTVAFTPLGATLLAIFPKTFPLIEPAVARHVHPFLWDPVLLSLFTAPTFAVAAVIGLAFLWLGRRPAEPIGFSTKR